MDSLVTAKEIIAEFDKYQCGPGSEKYAYISILFFAPVELCILHLSSLLPPKLRNESVVQSLLHKNYKPLAIIGLWKTRRGEEGSERLKLFADQSFEHFITVARGCEEGFVIRHDPSLVAPLRAGPPLPRRPPSS
jgi:hypothetical protein